MIVQLSDYRCQFQAAENIFFVGSGCSLIKLVLKALIPK